MSITSLRYARDAAQRAIRDWKREHPVPPRFRGGYTGTPAWFTRRLEQAEAALAKAKERE